jgi:transposase
MEESTTKGKKRSQRDYNMAFKLSVISQVEQGEMTYKQAQLRYGIQGKSTVLVWLRKHGALDWSRSMLHMRKNPRSKETPAQRIKRLEKQLEDEKLKNKVLQRMVNLIEKETKRTIRKKSSPEQSENSKKNSK